MLANRGVVHYGTLALIRAASAVALIAVHEMRRIPPVTRLLNTWFTDDLPLEWVDKHYGVEPSAAAKRVSQYAPPRSIQVCIAALSGLELVCWLAVFGNHLALTVNEHQQVRLVVLAGVMALVWLFLTLRSVVRPSVTPPWSSLIIFLILCSSSLFALGDVGYSRFAFGMVPAWANRMGLILEAANAVATALLAAMVGKLRFSTPTTLAEAPELGEDDKATLFQWITFTWLTPFIAFASTTEMEPSDLPVLSPTLQARIVFARFREVAGSSLVWQIINANRFDVGIDIALTIVSVIFNYMGPFFLKQILDGIEKYHNSKVDKSPRPEYLAQAYVFAFGAFLATIFKGISDLIHLWHSRRASVRIKAALTAVIYDKALRRQDASGVIAQKEAEDDKDKKGKDDKGKGKDDKGKKSEPEPEKSGSADTGRVMNLMAGDATRVGGTASTMYMIYGTPIELIVASTFLYNILGWSAFTGIVVMIVATPLNSMVSKRSVQIQKDLLKARDKRVTVMNELIGAITFIKFFAWTEKWKKRAEEARQAELKHTIRAMINYVFFMLLWSLVPIAVTLCAFFSYIVIAKRELTVSVAFTAVNLFSMLRAPLNTIPMFIVYILQTKVSVKRIQDFLAEPEVPDWVSSLKRSDTISTGPARIAFENATLRWNSGGKDKTKNGNASETLAETTSGTAEDIVDDAFELSDLSIDFPTGKLTVLTGPTGAGKTAALVALLGEMDLVSGKSYLPKYVTQMDKETGLRNSVAYAAQTPWLQQQSIRDNILFGERLDEERYEAVVDACALRPDFDILEDGDDTEIGAKGVSLSGGQKARVALARAVYSFTQHILLDDPLAAVDSHTAKHLVDECLKGPLLRGRTVILVSHHLDLLAPKADYIVRILDGRVDCQGTPDQLKKQGELDGVVAMEEAEAALTLPVRAIDAEDIVDDSEAEPEVKSKKSKKKGPARKLVKDEERAVGNVKFATYMLYIRSATYLTWGVWLVVMVFAQGLMLGERLWLKVWGEAYNTKTHALFTFFTPSSVAPALDMYHRIAYHQQGTLSQNASTAAALVLQSGEMATQEFNFPSAAEHPGFYLKVYTAIVMATALGAVLANAISSWGSYRAAKKLHNELLDSVVHGTVRFFNTTPVGRILNRFTKDIETIDSTLGGSLRTVLVFAGSLISSLFLVAFNIPSFLFAAAIISYAYYSYAILYLRAGRGLRRLEATSKSPIFSGFGELLDGVISVRAFCAERRFFDKLCKQVDQSNSAYYNYWMLNRWLLLRFDVLGATAIFASTLLGLTGAVTAGTAGVIIVSAQGFVMACYWISRFWGQLEMDFNSVERVEEYLHIPQEPASIIEGHRPPAYWPSYSASDSFISARDLEIKYSPELPTVFKGSFDIKAGEKIGLIGRTGSGKSTLAMSLLRFADPASGSLWIDGIDITTIGVDDLRSRITYIPQDAVLFSGTVRDNLDPFQEHSDAELWDVLTRVSLNVGETPITGTTPAISRVPSHSRIAQVAAEIATEAHPGKASSVGTATPSGRGQITLNTEVSAGGGNFSQGQRQLVAMARALLRRSNLIIMDEATASVDFVTDEKLQAAIRSEFKESTLITIAHRLTTVIDFDRLLVLDDGKVAEYDTPINLLRQDKSLFKSLCQKSGKYKELYRAAERKERGGDVEELVEVSS